MKLCLACQEQFDGESWKCLSCGHSPAMRSGYWSFAQEMANLSDGFDPHYFSALAKIEETHWWFVSRRELVIWALRRYFFPFKSFLEVGCGTGFMLSGIREAFSDLRLSGSDLFLEGLDYVGQRLPTVSLFQMDARKIPFSEEFDVIGAFDVLEHVEEDEGILSQIFKAVKRGGGTIITVPQHPVLWSQQDRYSFHKRRYTRSELIEKLERAGFRIVRATSYVFLLLPLMFLSRLARSMMDDEFDVFGELRIGNSLNVVLSRIMSAELSMVRRGLCLPAGGSLLLVGRKL